MIGAAIAYMSGLFFASFFLNRTGIAAAVFMALLAIIYGKHRSFKTADAIILIASFAAATSVNLLYTAVYVKPVKAYYGIEASFTGTVSDFDVHDGGFATYVLKGKINGSTKAKLLFRTYELDADLGDKVIIEMCAFSEIDSDYLFDSKTWNISRHIYVEGVPKGNVEVRKTDSAKLKRLLACYRKQIISDLRIEMGTDKGNILSGMIFGEKRYLDDETKTAFYRCGIGHILAVSGLHVSITAALIMKLLKRLRINKYLRFATINLLFAALIALTNYPVSAIRAALMLDIMYSAELFLQQNNSLNSLSAAALIICICDPYAVYNSGFILSLSGTFGIAVFSPYMIKNIDTRKFFGKTSAAFVTAVCTSLSVMPASMYYFDETSVISPVSNILLIPLCTASMIIGLMYIVTGGIFPFLLIPAKLMLCIVLKLSEAAAHIPYFHIPRTSSLLPILFAFSAAAVLAVYLFGKKKNAVHIALAAVIALDLISSATINKYNREILKIAILGKESNAAAVVSYLGRAVIADMSGHNRTSEYVRKYLTENGLNCIDCLILTKKINASYAAYENSLEYFQPQNVYSAANEDISLNCGDYHIDIKDGTFTVTAENSTVTVDFSKNKTEISSDNYDNGENRIYLCDMNNFEIRFTDKGQALKTLFQQEKREVACSIRRL